MSNTTSFSSESNSFSDFTRTSTTTVNATRSDRTSTSTLHVIGTFSVPSSEGSSPTTTLSATISNANNTSLGSTPKNSAAIIGGAIGAAVTAIGLVSFIFFFLRRQRRTTKDNTDPFLIYSPRYNTSSAWGRYQSSASHISRSPNGSNSTTGSFVLSTKYRQGQVERQTLGHPSTPAEPLERNSAQLSQTILDPVSSWNAPRVVVHQDSGVRLHQQRPVMDIPPEYTPC